MDIRQVDKQKLLIVDDNEQLLSMLNEYLAEHGYDVICSLSGEDAINIFSEFNPDLVITDIVMPDIDGIELLLNLRKINPTIKVIAMSGGNQGHGDTYLKMANKLGANTILNKPFKLSDLVDEIKKLLDSQ